MKSISNFCILDELPEYGRFVFKFYSRYTDRKLGPPLSICSRNSTLVFCIWSFELFQVFPGVYLWDACCSRYTHFNRRAFTAGDFVVQQQNQYFSQTSMDQTIEQTMDRLDSLIMVMLFIIGVYCSTNMQKSLEAVLKYWKSSGLP